ncbi:MAG: hypothetical protein JXB14_06995 [Candidatus Altiarchaeota archaeon]|nr:hypothetical protein [Candidatus Altiarchaeota archaeon]
MGSFALRGAIRYLREEHSDEELEIVMKICEDLAQDLSKKRGYLHPRALAAASSHIYKMKKGVPITLESTSASFRISTATLREYLRIYPASSSALEAAESILQNNLYGEDLRHTIEIARSLYGELLKKKSTINPSALAAAAVYILLYQEGKQVSLTNIANVYKISTSTLRDYISSKEQGIDHVERAKTILLKFVDDSEIRDVYRVVDDVSQTMDVSTSRILAAIAYYLYKIQNQEYTTIEKVARNFNVSIPALRSYLEPFFPSLTDSYLLLKKGRIYDVGEAMKDLNDKEMEMLNAIHKNFGTSIFELSLLYDIESIPRGRWQLFIRKLARLGFINIYKKPLDPKQYCSLVEKIGSYLSKPESLKRWV